VTPPSITSWSGWSAKGLDKREKSPERRDGESKHGASSRERRYDNRCLMFFS
jgi:hypothetical protein